MADTVSLQVSAIDAEGNGLTYVATGLPAGLSINATGLISGSIATGADTSSPYTVLVTVTDDGTPNESANISFGWSVTAANTAPTITAIADQSSTVADTVSLQVSAIDAEGDGLTYVATGLPAGLSINATGLISGCIATGADTSSPYTVLVTVTDDGAPNESANISFGWSVSCRQHRSDHHCDCRPVQHGG